MRWAGRALAVGFLKAGGDEAGRDLLDDPRPDLGQLRLDFLPKAIVQAQVDEVRARERDTRARPM